MSEWKENSKWVVSNKGIGAATGADITAANIFKGNAYINATKELLQNVEDALDPDLPLGTAAKAVIELVYANISDIPGSDRISDIICRCAAYLEEKGDGDNPAIVRLKKANERYLSGEVRIPVLKVSDYNTIGLCGNNFDGLLREAGIRRKNGDTSGSFGYGKYAPYRLSQLNTILYSSFTKENEFRFEGRAIFSTFRDADMKEKMNLTLFGIEVGAGEDCLPITDMQDVPEFYKRSEYGTDLYIVGFEPTNDWHHLIALSTLDNFFFAIMENKIEVEIRNGEEKIIISQDTLEDQMQFYRDYYQNNLSDNTQEVSFTAPCYWDVLKSPDVIHVTFADIRHKGEADFYFRLGPSDVNKTVLEMRSTGMKIQEEQFKQITDFCGVFVATAKGRESEEKDKNISKFLRSLETATHSSWNSNDAEEDDRVEADKVLKEITKLIRAAVRERSEQEGGEKFGAFGLGRFLADNTGSNPLNETKEEAYLKFQPVDLPTMESRKQPRKKKPEKEVNGRGHDEDDTDESENEGTPSNPNNRQRTKSLREISVKKPRTPFDRSSDTYRIAFTPNRDAEKILIRVEIADEDNEYSHVIPKEAEYNGAKAKIDGEYIVLENVRKDERISFALKLQASGRYALKVSAYVEQ